MYGYVIDGLNKDCIAAIASSTGAALNVASTNTIKCLKALNILPATSILWTSLATISDQRRLAAHGTRSPAKRIDAFDTFNRDLDDCVSGLVELLSSLEKHFKMTGEDASEIHYAKLALPKITRQAEKRYSICQIDAIVGKTVDHVEYGFREDIDDVHQSEAMILHFTDGSTLGIDTGSNAENLSGEKRKIKPSDFRVDFSLHWVPVPSALRTSYES